MADENAYIGTSSVEWKTELHWDDLMATETQGTGGAALTYAAIGASTSFLVFSFRTNQTDVLYLRYQVPHTFDPDSTDTNFHIHYSASAASDGTANFSGIYTWVAIDGTIPEDASWTTFSTDLAVVAADQFKHKIVSICRPSVPASVTESSILLIKVQRNGLTDSYAGDIQILSIDLHYQRNKMGTLDEIPT